MRLKYHEVQNMWQLPWSDADTATRLQPVKAEITKQTEEGVQPASQGTRSTVRQFVAPDIEQAFQKVTESLGENALLYDTVRTEDGIVVHASLDPEDMGRENFSFLLQHLEQIQNDLVDIRERLGDVGRTTTPATIDGSEKPGWFRKVIKSLFLIRISLELPGSHSSKPVSQEINYRRLIVLVLMLAGLVACISYV